MKYLWLALAVLGAIVILLGLITFQKRIAKFERIEKVLERIFGFFFVLVFVNWIAILVFQGIPGLCTFSLQITSLIISALA